MLNTLIDHVTTPTLFEVRQRIVTRQRALAGIPRLSRMPQLLPDPGVRGALPRPIAPPSVRGGAARPFSFARSTQQMERSSWLTDCLTMAVTLLNIALWAALLSLW